MIEIKITGDTPREALVAITAWGMYCMTIDEIREAATRLMSDTVNKNHDSDHKAPEHYTPPSVVTPPAPSAAPVAPPTTVPPPATTTGASPAITPAGAFSAMGGPGANAPQFSPPPAPVVPVAPPPGFTIDQIATVGAALVQAGKMPALMALLGQFGIQAVTELKPEQLGPFATALRGLGGTI